MAEGLGQSTSQSILCCIMMPADHPVIDICICTYNRTEYLGYCLDALLTQSHHESISITVIDNAGNAETKSMVMVRQAHHPQVRYIHEPQTGLSYARNTAWKQSAAAWILYLDDDCLPMEPFVQEAIALATPDQMFDAMGGPIEAVYKGEKPDWLPEGFGSFSMPYTTLIRIESGYIRGGCMMFKRSVLEQMQGFATHLGVKGHRLRYGEEIELQIRMRQAGYQIAYAPSLRTGHFVREDKLRLSWLLRSEYARRRDKMRIEPIGIAQSTVNLLRTSTGRLIRLPAYGFQMLFSKGIDSRKISFEFFKPMAYRLGEWVGSVKGKP